YRNTGRILTIIPQVNSQGLVNLQIKAEVSERGTEVTVGRDTFPSFETRDAETTAVVQDGETLFIGGIINERKIRSRAGIPLLMDIPILGYLFGITTNSVERTELVMLITPHVIRNSEEARSVTEEFKERLSAVTQEIERAKKEREQKKERP
ncbi:MAG: type II secretion system protein GspD, partial [Nitrospirota bacterium]